MRGLISSIGFVICHLEFCFMSHNNYSKIEIKKEPSSRLPTKAGLAVLVTVSGLTVLGDDAAGHFQDLGDVRVIRLEVAGPRHGLELFIRRQFIRSSQKPAQQLQSVLERARGSVKDQFQQFATLAHLGQGPGAASEKSSLDLQQS